MKFKTLLYYLIIIFLSGFCTPVFAQDYNQDSLDYYGNKPKALELFNNKTVTYTIGEDDEVYHVDTLMDELEIYDPALKSNFEFRNTGNLGGAAYGIAFNPFRQFGFNMGYNQFDLYGFNRFNVPHYTAKGPFTEMYMQIGQKKEHQFNIRHHQPLGKIGTFDFHLNRLRSDGFYTREIKQQSNVAVNLKLGPKNNRYVAEMAFFINDINAQENGGVVNLDLFNTDSSFLQKTLIEVQLQDAVNKYKPRSMFVTQTINFGKTIITTVDSIEQKTIHPKYSIYHRIGLSNDKYIYTDGDPDSTYYKSFYSYYNMSDDSDFEYLTQLRQMTNTLGFVHQIIKSTDSTGVKYKNYHLELWTDYQLLHLEEDSINQNLEDNLSAGVTLKSSPLGQSPFKYKIHFNYFFKGYNKGDIDIIGQLSYKFKKAGKLGIHLKAQANEPEWIYKSYTRNWPSPAIISSENYFDNISKTYIVEFGLNYTLSKYRLKTKLAYIAVNNLFNWPDIDIYSRTLSVNTLVFELQKNFRAGGFGNDNFFRLQWLGDKDKQVLRFPTYYSFHTLFYEFGLFKKKLMIRFGLDVHYSTNYFAPGYMPITGQFYLQEDDDLKFYPVMDVFLATTLKTFRIFFKFDHVNQGMFKENGYYNFYRYPGLERSFKFGFSWQFYN